jgi:hypothetical protein
MEPALVELAVSAASTLVNAVTTESYEAAKKAVLRLWRRHAPAHAEMIEETLETTRAEVVGASEAEAAQTAQDLNAEWLAFFRTLLRSHPDAADDVRQVVQELTPLIASNSAQNARDIKQVARVEGGISIQAGNTVNSTIGNVTIGKNDKNEQP